MKISLITCLGLELPQSEIQLQQSSFILNALVFLKNLKYMQHTMYFTFFCIKFCGFCQVHTVVYLSPQSQYRTFPLPPKFSVPFVINFFTYPLPLATTDLLLLCYHLPFPECPINRTIQDVDFGVGFLSQHNTVNFFLSLNSIPLCQLMDIWQL